MASRYEEKFRQGAAPYLEEGEEVLAALITQPKGRTQMTAGAGNLVASELGARKVRKAHEAAGDIGLVLGSPMAMAVTNRRLLTMKISTPVLGKGGDVKELLSAVSLDEVEAISVKRFGLAKRITLVVRGTEVQLEAAAGADALVEAFEQAKAATA